MNNPLFGENKNMKEGLRVLTATFIADNNSQTGQGDLFAFHVSCMKVLSRTYANTLVAETMRQTRRAQPGFETDIFCGKKGRNDRGTEFRLLLMMRGKSA
ncbi:MAG TPA: hypothetical protein VFH91_01240 [Pyrinomonadaceae bacterium]|nr:hypothetical protein [Pyrinomonadaceae bacterium]